MNPQTFAMLLAFYPEAKHIQQHFLTAIDALGQLVELLESKQISLDRCTVDVEEIALAVLCLIKLVKNIDTEITSG